MAIFAVAGLIGLFASWAWTNFDPQKELQRCCAELLALVVLGVAGWLILHDDLAGFGDGNIARAALGVVAGHLIYRFLTNEPTTGQISIALALAILASAAPHIDRWMSKLSGFKGAGFEFQLASAATANKAIVVAQSMELYMSDVVFATLLGYSEMIQADINFIDLAELPKTNDADRRRQLQRTRAGAADIKPVFEGLIGKIAGCIDDQIKTGMNVERIRPIVHPISILLQQIVLSDVDDDMSNDEQHIKFWSEVAASPKVLAARRLISSTKCKDAGEPYLSDHKDKGNHKDYPRISDSRDLPYLYVPAAFLIFFSGETETALRILEKARSRLIYQDHKVLALIGLFRSYRGQPAAKVIEPYKEMEKLAKQRKALFPDNCATRCDDKLKKVWEREVFYERVAINNVASAIADDLARGYNSAKDLEATAEIYTKLLEDILSAKDLAPEAAEAFIDTYAFAKAVIEAHKKTPDKAVFVKMARMLQGVAEAIDYRIRDALDKGQQPRQAEIAKLNTVRVHLNSVRDLASD